MPRRPDKNSKSEAVRTVLRQNPKASAKEVTEELAQKGVSVTAALVYKIKGRLFERKVQRRRKAARVAGASQKSGIGDPVALIRKVKELAHEAGGMENLKGLVAVLSE